MGSVESHIFHNIQPANENNLDSKSCKQNRFGDPNPRNSSRADFVLDVYHQQQGMSEPCWQPQSFLWKFRYYQAITFCRTNNNVLFSPVFGQDSIVQQPWKMFIYAKGLPTFRRYSIALTAPSLKDSDEPETQKVQAKFEISILDNLDTPVLYIGNKTLHQHLFIGNGVWSCTFSLDDVGVPLEALVLQNPNRMVKILCKIWVQNAHSNMYDSMEARQARRKIELSDLLVKNLDTFFKPDLILTDASNNNFYLVHSALLSVRSQVFARLLECRPKYLNIPFPAYIVEKLIKYICEGEIVKHDEKIENVCQLLKAAIYYSLDELKEECEEILSNAPSNCLRLC